MEISVLQSGCQRWSRVLSNWLVSGLVGFPQWQVYWAGQRWIWKKFEIPSDHAIPV